MAETTKQVLVQGAGYGNPIRISSRQSNGGQYPSVTCVPGGGGTMSIQYTTSTVADVTANIASWNLWPKGSVSAYATDSLAGCVTFVRALATIANGTLEVCQ